MHSSASQLTLFPERQTSEVENPGEMPGFSVRESARARRLSIKVYPRGRVEVVVPKRTRPDEVAEFVSENQAWISQALESFADDISAESYRLPSQVELTSVQKRAVVSYRPRRNADSVRHRELGGTLVLTGDVANEQKCTLALRRWLTKVARREFEAAHAPAVREFCLPFERLQIRAQRTCWGSRSSSGTISLNLSLLFLEAPVVRYLMVHELCHGRHMDHSEAFWKLVSRFEPAYRRLDRELGESWKRVPAWLGLY